MNNFNRFELRFRKYCIPDLPLYLAILYTVGLVISFVNPSFYVQYLSLNAAMILRGQIWRIVTWLMYPPSTGILGIVMIYVYYEISRNLSHVWGDFRFNLFILAGVLLHVLAVLIVYAVNRPLGTLLVLTPQNFNLSILLAFMASFPDSRFLLFFVVPVKAKYLGIFYVVLTLISFVSGGISTRIEIAVSLINVLLFLLYTGRLEAMIWRFKNRGKKYR